MIEREIQIERFLEEMIEDGTICGASCAFVRVGEQKLLYKGKQGVIDPYKDRAVGPGMYYDLASLSKVVGTASRLLQLSEERKLKLTTPVSRILKRFRYPDITIENLLLHNSGLPAEIPNKECLTKDNIIDCLYQTPVDDDCGRRFIYSDVGYMLLGLVIMELDGTGLEESFHTHIFTPLGMPATSFVTKGDLRLYVPTECTRTRGCIHGEVHDSKAHLLGPCGSAGLFSSLNDLASFVHAYITRNECLFSEDTFHKMIETDCMGRTYGWSREYGGGWVYHTGFTGTSILIDMDRREGMALLTNRIHPSRDNEAFLEKRRKINEIYMGRLQNDTPLWSETVSGRIF